MTANELIDFYTLNKKVSIYDYRLPGIIVLINGNTLAEHFNIILT